MTTRPPLRYKSPLHLKPRKPVTELPPEMPAKLAAVELRAFLDRHPSFTLLTGAGVSTDSGIPDYRDEKGAWKRSPPVQHHEFIESEAVRKRYWARSLIGWPFMQNRQPNRAHEQMAHWDNHGLATLTVTQNVDELHQRAGSRQVVDLHGRAGDILCLQCDYRCQRADLHEQSKQLNPDFAKFQATEAPDGDADLDINFDAFQVIDCPQCAGILKPDVVFFGDSVPAARVEQVKQAIEKSDALLVIGSSLMVFSGYRFALHTQKLGKPIAILNRGHTRADDIATLKLHADIGETLRLV